MAGLQSDVHGRIVMALRPSTRVQNLLTSAASVVSTVFLPVNQNTQLQDTGVGQSGPTGTTHVRLCSTADCWITFGPNNPVAATATSMLLPAGTPEYFPVQPLDQIAALQVTVAGTLNIVECS
jgi:hypothetical protein